MIALRTAFNSIIHIYYWETMFFKPNFHLPTSSKTVFLTFFVFCNVMQRFVASQDRPRAPIFTERKNCQIFNFKTH